MFSVSPVKMDVTYDEYGVPETMLKYEELIDVLIGLKYSEDMDKVVMTLVKDGDDITPHPMQVNLDPKTMLIVN